MLCECNPLGGFHEEDMGIETSYLELSVGTSHKFYEVTVEATQVILRYGRISTEGRREEYNFDTESQAQTFAQRKIDEKLRKGYQHAQLGVTGKKPIEKPDLDERGIFWRLIELSRKGSEGDPYAQLDNLRQRLMKLPEEELRSFDRIFWELMNESYHADLWGAAYIIKDGCSDDGFDYFRGWLIMQGEQPFTEALRNPDSLAPRARRGLEMGSEFEFEEILGIAGSVYEAQTGRSDFHQTQPTHQANLIGDLDAWSDVDSTAENTRRLYPRLWKLFLDQ
jgi:predicted DNA-binding WGR domain protein